MDSESRRPRFRSRAASFNAGNTTASSTASGELSSADSSIWEVHWNGEQKHFAYTTLTAANGLCRAAKLAGRVGDGARADSYLQAGALARDALTLKLAANDGTLVQSLEDLSSKSNFLDAAAIEAVALGLVDPKGKATSATLASSVKLQPPEVTRPTISSSR